MQYKNYNNSFNYFYIILIILFLTGGFRIVLGLFGFIIAIIIQFLPLIIFGFFIYMIFKSITKNAKINEYLSHSTEDHQKFVELTVRIIAYVIQADNKIDHREIEVVLSFFASRLGYAGNKLAWISDLIKSAINENPPLEELCREFNTVFNYESKLILLELVYNVAAADQNIAQEEILIIDKIVLLSQISDIDHERIKSVFENFLNKDEYHYKVLGINENATAEEIKKPTRTLVKPITRIRFFIWVKSLKVLPKRK
ncbi:TerB family tellurite resistance protein [Candidatus Margulisiibacteriota bacterium]